jgi:xanthine dehydrogenase YagT iron-sulfur-binding subunit
MRRQREEASMSRDDEEHPCRCRGITRRQFLHGVGAGAVVVTAAAHIGAREAKASEVLPAGELARVTLSINGRRRVLLVEPRTTLLTVLREGLGLTAAKAGCERGECGACTVLFNDLPRYACLTLAVEAQGAEITTLEGLLRGEELGPVQQAFLENDAFQCGYCTPGQIVAVEGLLRAAPDPTLEQIRQGVSGNLCRCGAYVNIFAAAKSAAALRKRG